MKNTIIVEPRGVVQLSNNENANVGESVYVKNLRERDGAFEAVGEFAPFSELVSGEKLLLVYDIGHSTHVLTHDGANVYWHSEITGGEETLRRKHVAKVNGTIVKALRQTGCVVVWTTEQPVYLRFTGESYVVLNVLDIKPLIKINATEQLDFEQSYDGLEFATPYASWRELSAVDESLLSRVLRGAYNNLSSSVATSGRYKGMVLARYGIRLYDDSYLWLSAPVLVGAESAARQWAEGEAESGSAGITGIGAFRLSMASYRLGITPITAFGEEFDEIIKSVDVLVSEERVLYDHNGRADYRCLTSTTGEREQKLQFAWPEINATTATMALLSGNKWRVATSTTNFASLREGLWDASNVKHSSQPHIDGCVTSAVQFNAACAPFDAKGDKVTVREVKTPRMGLKCAILSAGTMVASGIKLRNDVTWSIADYFDGKQAKASAVATIRVQFMTSEGEKEIVRWENVPIEANRLNAVLAYPDSRATHMAIEMQGGGNVMRWESDLSPAGNGFAVAVEPMAQSFAFSDTGEAFITVPEIRGFDDDLRGGVYVGRRDNAFVGEVRDVLGCEAIRWVSATLKPLSGSAFGRYPLILFSEGGVYALPQTSQGSYGEARLVSRVRAAETVAPCECGERLCFVSEGGSLMALRGSVVTRIMRRCKAVEMAWNAAEDELLMRDGDGTVSVVMNSGRSYVRSAVASEIYSCVGYVLMVEGNKVKNVQQELYAGNVEVEWLSHPIMINRILRAGKRMVSWNIKGESTMTLQVCGERGYCDCGFRIATVDIEGRLTAPLDVRIYSPNLRALRLSAVGIMSRGGLLLPVVLV